MVFLDFAAWELTVVVVAVLAAGFLRGFTGFGGGLVIAPVLSVFIGPTSAVAVTVIVDLAASLTLMRWSLPRADWRQLVPIIAMGWLAIPLGAFLLFTIDAEIMQRVIAGAVLVFALILLRGWRYHVKPRLAVAMGVGAAGGILNGMTSAGGPPVILYFLSGPSSADRNRATFIAYSILIHTGTLIVLAAGPGIDEQTLIRAAVFAPVQLAGMWIGSRFFSRSNEGQYRRIALGFIAAVAIYGLIA